MKVRLAERPLEISDVAWVAYDEKGWILIVHTHGVATRARLRVSPEVAEPLFDPAIPLPKTFNPQGMELIGFCYQRACCHSFQEWRQLEQLMELVRATTNPAFAWNDYDNGWLKLSGPMYPTALARRFWNP